MPIYDMLPTRKFFSKIGCILIIPYKWHYNYIQLQHWASESCPPRRWSEGNGKGKGIV